MRNVQQAETILPYHIFFILMMATALTKENVRIQTDDLNPRVNMLELETLNCRFRFLKDKSNK